MDEAQLLSIEARVLGNEEWGADEDLSSACNALIAALRVAWRERDEWHRRWKATYDEHAIDYSRAARAEAERDNVVAMGATLLNSAEKRQAHLEAVREAAEEVCSLLDNDRPSIAKLRRALDAAKDPGPMTGWSVLDAAKGPDGAAK